MATIALQNNAEGSVFSLVKKPFNAIGTFLVQMAEANHRVQRVRALQDMSDAQLATKGIKREDIVRTVYADLMYI